MDYVHNSLCMYMYVHRESVGMSTASYTALALNSLAKLSSSAITPVIPVVVHAIEI